MRTLVISTWYPFPADNGSRIRAYYLLRELAARHEVTLLAFRPSNGPLAQRRPPGDSAETWGLRLVEVDEDPFRHVSAPKAVRYLSPIPLAFARSRHMDEAARRLGRDERWDAVVALQSPAARYARHAAGAARVLDLDAPLTAQLQRRYLSAGGIGRLSRWVSWQKARHYETAVARQFDCCTVVSEQELRLAQAMVEGAGTEVVLSPNGVDIERYQPDLAQRAANSLVYNGAMTYQANYDAVCYFLNDIYPLIKAAAPAARFRVTGSTRDVAVAGLALDESVTLTGYVEDIRLEVARAAVCVIPLREGGGTRLKILEALALGTPVVSTSKGAEGLAVEAGEHVLIADDPEQFARKTVRLLRDEALRRQLAANGRQLVEARYDWRQIGREYAALVESLVTGRRKD